jgi:hypothetical protein
MSITLGGRRRGPGRALHRDRPRPAWRACGAARRCDRIGQGSRGICYAKRTLEILDRLGVAERASRRASPGSSVRCSRHELLYGFDLLPEAGHKMPAFINLQQYTSNVSGGARGGVAQPGNPVANR